MINHDPINLNKNLLKHYGALAGWTKEEAITLLGNLNPRCKNETINFLKIAGNDVLTMESLNRAIDCGEISYVDGLIKPLEFVNWCKLKDLNFPLKLEVLVRKYHKSECVDWEAKYKEVYFEFEKQQVEIAKLTKESQSIPNAKRIISLEKGFIGGLATKYGAERLQDNFGDSKKTIDTNKKLTLVQIQRDYALEGIALDDQTIRDLIKETIHRLKDKI